MVECDPAESQVIWWLNETSHRCLSQSPILMFTLLSWDFHRICLKVSREFFLQQITISTYFNLLVCHLIVYGAVLGWLGRWHVNFCFQLAPSLLVIFAIHVDAITLIIGAIHRSIWRRGVCKRVAACVGIAAHVGVRFLIYIWVFHRVVLLHIFLCTFCVIADLHNQANVRYRIYKWHLCVR